jgi:hypothetical protein
MKQTVRIIVCSLLCAYTISQGKAKEPATAPHDSSTISPQHPTTGTDPAALPHSITMEPLTDTAAKTPPYDRLSTATSDPIVTPYAFELIDCSLHNRAIARLNESGVVIGEGTVLAMGFERGSGDAESKNLAVIVLGRDNRLEKRIFQIDKKLYDELSEKSVTIGDTTERRSPAAETTRNESAPPTKDRRQDGRLYFMLNTTARSLWVYPSAFGTTIRGVDGNVIAGLSLFTLGGSLYGSYLFSKNIELGYGRVEFMNFGADMGGIYYPQLLQLLWNQIAPESNSNNNDEYDDNRPYLSGYSAMIGFPLGIFLGSKMKFAGNYQYGNASIMTNLSRVAPVYGFAIPTILWGDDVSEKKFVTVSSALSMALIPAGFYLGTALIDNRDFSSGRSILITASGIFGALSGLAIPVFWDSAEPRVYGFTLLAGHLAGTYFGFNFKKEEEYSYGQGIFTAVSTVVGTGIGLAFPLIINANDLKAYIGTGMLGGWAGLLTGEILSKSLFEKSTHDNRVSSAISFPGFSSLPLLLLSQKFAHGDRKATRNIPPEFLPQASILEVHF